MSGPLPEGFTRLRTIYCGAEAVIDLCEWMGMRVIVKTRVPKGYRIRELDELLRRSRTIREASLLRAAKLAGVSTPFIYHVNPVAGWIVMNYVEGSSLRSMQGSRVFQSLVNKLGFAAGRLHAAGIIHGDLTPSNVIVSGGELTLIDFGLGELSKEVEKRAEDLYVLVSSLRTLPGSEGLVEDLMEGYRDSAGGFAGRVEERLIEIGRRGRYVERRVRQ
ncbi:MAG: KEOPS complex kinase/ATPase Bud32 [Thermoproteota archaeon]